jgi:colanic acid/amylovoran biosynthesis glycosyltransferase
MNKIHVLHATHSWIKNTENWCKRLILSVPSVETSILSRLYFEEPRDAGFGKFSWPFSSGMNRTIYNFVGKILRRLPVIESWVLSRMVVAKIDIIHAHFSFVGWDVLRYAKIKKIPLAISFYGFDYEKIPMSSRKWERRYTKLFRDADMFICEGEHGRNALINRGCPKEKIKIVRLGIDTRSIILNEYKVRGKCLQVIQVATLTEKKGHEYSIRALAVAAKVINIKLTIVGKSADIKKEDLLALCKNLGVDDKVEFVDGVEFSKLKQYMRSFDVFIHPSTYARDGDCEGGAPVVLLDAQSLGLPVVATTHCDIPEEVIDGVTGYLHAERDYISLGKSLIKLFEMSDEQFLAFQKSARDHVLNSYNIEKSGYDLFQVYQQIIGQK